ncbi:hypothetical protein OIU74_024374 [Salix koriyanagi]|uniref:Uncharacterized protein n=1 Tax=Salix koriyanagi TaxID=2511006 RepID=A0A9Q0W9N6_9ROSI|nr:hypothetical protein OIU74_024374 [Salix koriyanagi]
MDLVGRAVSLDQKGTYNFEHLLIFVRLTVEAFGNQSTLHLKNTKIQDKNHGLEKKKKCSNLSRKCSTKCL